MIIQVPERGSVDVTQEVWLGLSAQPDFWKLVASNILFVEGRAGARWRLRGSCYVGRSTIGKHIVEACEKVPGSFEALVRLMGIGRARVVKVGAPVSREDHTAALLVSLFVLAVRRYLSGNKKVAYVQKRDRGALIGGRLDIGGTARLRARGILHQAAFFRTVLSADLPINRAIYAALMRVERLSAVLPINPSDTASARALRMGMSECLEGAMTASSRELSEVALAESLAPGNREPVADVMSLTAAILDSASFGGGYEWGRTVNRSWFVNLENMFERAVRRETQALLPCFVVSGPTERPGLFDDLSGRYRANPDVVIRCGTKAVAIGDAKYKDLEDEPSSPDVYELIAHAAAYKVSKAFLAYPSDGPLMIRSLGASSTGCSVWVAALPFQDFTSHCSELLHQVGLIGEG